jgi:AcrR family transcriptional regulator
VRSADLTGELIAHAHVAAEQAETPPLRQQILEVFVELVADRGYAQTAFSDIATRLGISKGTIVHHFKTKDALLAELGSTYIGRRRSDLEYLLATLDEPFEQLVALILTITVCHRDDRAASRAFGREFTRFAEEPSLESVRRERDEYTGLVADVIRRAMDAGQLRRGNARLALLQVFGLCNWTWTWYRPEGALAIEQIAECHVRTLVAGLAVPAACEAVERALPSRAVAAAQSAAGGISRSRASS